MKEKLYPFHVVILIYMIQTGVVIFSLPRLLAQSFGYNGWASLLIFTGVSTFNIFLISFVYRLGKGRSIFDILENSMPKVLVYPLYLVMISVWGILGCIVGKLYIIIFQMIAFPTTPPMFLNALVDIIAYLLIVKGIYSISKAATSFFWISIWMLLLLVFFLHDFEWANLTPFLFMGKTEMIKGGLDIYTAFLGYELSLLLFPYVEKNNKFIKSVYIGNLFTISTYLLISFICFGFYSLGQLTKMNYPLLDLLSYIRFPFIERIENLLFGFFLFTELITIVMYIWSAVETLHRIIPKANTNWLTIFILGGCFVVTWIPDSISEIERWLRYLGYAEIGIAFGLPLLLVGILFISKGADRNA
ncbi:spore germination protein (amino acid permease) [Paenibacillus sp. yr247]|uniref:GerAB/ArcD/ProY family transporter n=1 Tax=Paenibacillus sp. yr247 TaxID=1761880 RepID=UPI0008827BBD|nr:GerAB/ArcD/ProY family transporter [Paenibacillus sp. yr247]SDN93647.1 spore germination protein (amino acid permease) [Paenibacillus sp. yr247]